MMKLIALSLVALLGAACGGDDGVDSDEEARRAYFGLDSSIGKSLTLGFAGFNTATSANIAPQMTTGVLAGTLVISGQVDQGSSDNKGMRLKVGMVDYNDGTLVIDGEELDVDITYNTPSDVTLQPALTLSLKNIPPAGGAPGTLEGTLLGDYAMGGDLEGTINLNLTFAGAIVHDGTSIIRAVGTTTVTGTANSGDGTYDVNITL
ncbi:MAG: hypothetical protein H0X17_04775 [Deltaproteobacteria bacterium]|nr:hypothetical protein [Deltaproteobacteria bacterium]